MDLKKIFKKKAQEEDKNTFSEFDTGEINSTSSPFSSKEMEDLATVAVTTEDVGDKKEKFNFLNFIKKVKKEKSGSLLQNVDNNKENILSKEKKSEYKTDKALNESTTENTTDSTTDSATDSATDRKSESNDKYDFEKSEKEEVILLDSSITVSSVSSSSIDRRSLNMDVITDGENSYKEKTIPFLSKFPVNKQYRVATLAALISLAGLGLGLFQYYNVQERQSNNIVIVSDLNNNTQKFENQFSGAILGKKDAYSKTKALWDLIDKNLIVLTTIPNEYSGDVQDKTRELSKNIRQSVDGIQKNIKILSDNAEFVQNTAGTILLIENDIKDMNDLLDRLGSVYTQLGANQAEMANIYFLKNTLQSINSNVTSVLLSELITTETIASLNKSISDFKKTLELVYNGDETKGINPLPSGIPMNSYKNLANTWLHFTEKLNVINTKGNDLVAVRSLSSSNSVLTKKMNSSFDSLTDLMKNSSYSGLLVGESVAMFFAMFLILSILLVFYIYNVEKDNRNLVERINNNKNQASIFKLVREMTPLQDGDLTKKTSINDEVIGLLADSINATIDSLASLVKKIKDASLSMKQKTGEVNIISVEMLRTNEEQSTAIQETGRSVITIAQAIDAISQKTDDGAQVAENSVKVSTQGAEQVLASLNSMQKINENMNETALLMKKVTDSSKKISEIVELLSDISENTSILALNATVQAAKAGEAGKGFKVVADSIQELADKAGEATRSVGALIAAVQTDIQAAEDAVNKTTDEVSSGADLSEKASESLNQMTEVSNNLALIVRSISEDAKKNATESKAVATKMNQILTKTEENKQSTQKTVNSISEIAHISNQLGESVQSFKVD